MRRKSALSGLIHPTVNLGHDKTIRNSFYGVGRPFLTSVDLCASGAWLVYLRLCFYGYRWAEILALPRRQVPHKKLTLRRGTENRLRRLREHLLRRANCRQRYQNVNKPLLSSIAGLSRRFKSCSTSTRTSSALMKFTSASGLCSK